MVPRCCYHKNGCSTSISILCSPSFLWIRVAKRKAFKLDWDPDWWRNDWNTIDRASPEAERSWGNILNPLSYCSGVQHSSHLLPSEHLYPLTTSREWGQTLQDWRHWLVPASLLERGLKVQTKYLRGWQVFSPILLRTNSWSIKNHSHQQVQQHTPLNN